RSGLSWAYGLGNQIGAIRLTYRARWGVSNEQAVVALSFSSESGYIRKLFSFLHIPPGRASMKTDIHPEYATAVVKCACGNTFENELADARELVLVDDPEMATEAAHEVERLERTIADLEARLKPALLPHDPLDDRNAIIEIRAGTGGDEAALFAADLYRMYTRFIERAGWRRETISHSEGALGGVKEAVFKVSGDGAFGAMRWESGVHRVQRVPATETQGRIHTSAATVAVLPEAEEVDVKIEDKDLRIDVFRSSGPGGQSVNTTDS